MCKYERGISVIFIVPFGYTPFLLKTYFIIFQFFKKSIFHSKELRLSLLCVWGTNSHMSQKPDFAERTEQDTLTAELGLQDRVTLLT